MKYKLAIFDMDGTILDTLDDLADSLNHALTCNGYPKRTLSEVRSFVGNGIHKLIERAVPKGTSEHMVEQVFSDFNLYYKEHCAIMTKPYDGILELLQELRLAGIRTAVVSNKADYAVQLLCKQYFDGLFDVAVGEQPTVRRKPAPDSVNLVLEKLHITREESVYIGDSEVDIETAKNVGMELISVDWGFRDREYLKVMGSSKIVSQPSDIYTLLLFTRTSLQ